MYATAELEPGVVANRAVEGEDRRYTKEGTRGVRRVQGGQRTLEKLVGQTAKKLVWQQRAYQGNRKNKCCFGREGDQSR